MPSSSSPSLPRRLKMRNYEMLNVNITFYDEYLLAETNSDLLGNKRTRQKVTFSVGSFVVFKTMY